MVTPMPIYSCDYNNFLHFYIRAKVMGLANTYNITNRYKITNRACRHGTQLYYIYSLLLCDLLCTFEICLKGWMGSHVSIACYGYISQVPIHPPLTPGTICRVISRWVCLAYRDPTLCRRGSPRIQQAWYLS